MVETRSDRRRRARSLFVYLSPLLVSVAAPSIARAQAPAGSPTLPVTPAAPPTKEQVAEAKKFFDAGLKLSKEGLYQEALASFIEANRLSPRESIQRNIAQTYRDLKDMANAYDATQTLLALYGEKMKPNLKSNAQHALEELEVLTGVIDVTVQEPGAKVTLDGKEVGVTPLAKPLRVGIGTHALTIAKEGFETLTQSVEIHGHDTQSVAGPLAKEIQTGHVTVAVTQTTPPDPTVRIFIDGKDVGAPPYQADLDPGTHTLEAKGTADVSPARPIEVSKKGTYSETLELHAQQGSLAVNVDVADTEITIDGNVVAHGVYEGMLPAGAHTLQITKPGFATYKKDFLVHDADKLTENVALQRDRSVPVAVPHDWRGLYSQLNLFGQFEVTTPTNDVAQGYGYTPDTTISGSGIGGGGLNVRVGYSFGFVGLEGGVLLGFDHSQASADVATSTITHPTGPGVSQVRTEKYDFNRVGGNIGLGVRLMPKTQIARPTLGIGGGVSIKAAFYSRSIAGMQSNESTDPALYAAPSLMADAGIELGSTPGTRFYVGCLVFAEFAGAVSVNPSSSYKDTNYPAPTPALNAVNGTDVFIGPILGMQFGE